MNKKYYQIFEELSRLHIVPYHHWNSFSRNILATLLENIPFFITDNGNIFIGEDAPAKIKNNRICLQAHLDHPGGKLYFSQTGDYMYSKIYGRKNSQSMVGRKFGAFLPGISQSLAELEVEHCQHNQDDYIILFFKANSDLIKDYQSEVLMVHYDSVPLIENNLLENWNLDDLLNAALIIYLLKYEQTFQDTYALLTLNEEVGHLGIYEFLNLIFDKNLFFINLDVIPSKSEIMTNFGIRSKQNQVPLDQFLPQAVIQSLDSKYLAEISSGVAEGVTLIKKNQRCVSLFVKIENFHNGTLLKNFAAEKISLSVLEEYLTFVKDISLKIEESLEKRPPSSLKNHHEKIEIVLTDHASEIKKLILTSEDYTHYLTEVLPGLRKIFSKYNLNIPNFDLEYYSKYKNFLDNKEINILNQKDIEETAYYLIAQIAEIFKIKKERFCPQQIEIVQILLGNFNACNHYFPNQIIMLSDDKISSFELSRLLTHELTHFLTANIWRGLNLPEQLKKYYNEGLAVYLAAQKDQLPLYESLGFSQENYQHYLTQKNILEQFFADFWKGNHCKLHQGKIHTYFIENKIPHPFYAHQAELSRYGYFLAALETKIAFEEGNYYEKLLC